MFTAMAFEIGLAIAVQIEPSSKNTPGDGPFPDRGADDFALPCDFTWKAHIDGQKFRHGILQMRAVPISRTTAENRTICPWIYQTILGASILRPERDEAH